MSTTWRFPRFPTSLLKTRRATVRRVRSEIINCWQNCRHRGVVTSSGRNHFWSLQRSHTVVSALSVLKRVFRLSGAFRYLPTRIGCICYYLFTVKCSRCQRFPSSRSSSAGIFPTEIVLNNPIGDGSNFASRPPGYGRWLQNPSAAAWWFGFPRERLSSKSSLDDTRNRRYVRCLCS